MSEDGKFRISDVRLGAQDRMGETIIRIYGGVEPLYAVYRTQYRVAVQYADDDARAAAQLTALRPLNLLRGQINALIDGWRQLKQGKNQRCAEHYDRRAAGALLTALQGDVPTAARQLTDVRDDIICQRRGNGRVWYLVMTGATAVLFLLASAFLSCPWAGRLASFSTVWTAVAGGTFGALFSILTGMRDRTILVDLRQTDNNIDAALRVATGAVAGGVLASLLISGLVANTLINTGAFGVDTKEPAQASIVPQLLTFVVGFLGGFAERLVPDLLGNVKLGLEEQSGESGGPPAPSPLPPPPTPPAADPAAANGQEGDAPDPDAADADAGPGDADAAGQKSADPPDPDATGTLPPPPAPGN